MLQHGRFRCLQVASVAVAAPISSYSCSHAAALMLSAALVADSVISWLKLYFAESCQVQYRYIELFADIRSSCRRWFSTLAAVGAALLAAAAAGV